MSQKVCVVYNAASGIGNKTSRLKDSFKKAGLEASYIAISPSVASDIKSQVAKGLKLFVAAGGDGTVNAVASCLAGRLDLTLAIIPCGTLNHFAKDLDIPTELEAAIEVVATGRPVLVDIGSINDLTFVNNSSIGIYARIASKSRLHSAWVFKWLRAVVSAVWFVLRPPNYRLAISIDGKNIVRSTPIVFIGNNHYDLSSLGLSNRSKLDEGRLCVYIITTRNPLRLILVCLSVFLGRINSVYFESVSATEVKINNVNKKLLVAYDGEAKRLTTPLEYKIMPKALRIIVPR